MKLDNLSLLKIKFFFSSVFLGLIFSKEKLFQLEKIKIETKLNRIWRKINFPGK